MQSELRVEAQAERKTANTMTAFILESQVSV